MSIPRDDYRVEAFKATWLAAAVPSEEGGGIEPHHVTVAQVLAGPPEHQRGSPSLTK